MGPNARREPGHVLYKEFSLRPYRRRMKGRALTVTESQRVPHCGVAYERRRRQKTMKKRRGGCRSMVGRVEETR